MAKEDNPFADLAADLDSSSSSLETQESTKESEARGENPVKKAAPKADPVEEPDISFEDSDPFELASDGGDKKPKKDNKPKEEEAEEDDGVEFPDFSQEDTYNFGDDDDEDTEEEEADEEVAAEVEESDTDDGEDQGGFNLNKVLDEIKDLNTPQLRKVYLENKARLRAIEIERDKFKMEAETATEEVTRARSEYLDTISAPVLPKLEEHEPFKKAVKEYDDWNARALRQVRDPDVRDKLADDSARLRSAVARVQSLSGEEYRKGYEQLTTAITKRYGEKHLDQIIEYGFNAAEHEIKAHNIRKEFEETIDSDAIRLADDQYKKTLAQTNESVMRAVSLSEDDIARNPYSLTAHLTRLLKDSKDGEKWLEVLNKDIKTVHRINAGPVPPDWSKFRNDKEREEAKTQYAQEFKALRQQKEQDIPTYAVIGAAATRLWPAMVKRLNELEAIAKKHGRGPNPTKGAAPQIKKKVDPSDEDSIRRELDMAIEGLG